MVRRPTSPTRTDTLVPYTTRVRSAVLETRRDVELTLRLFIFLGIGGADIADQMADRGARRIIACKAARRCDAGQVGQADEDRGIFGFADVLLDRDRLKPRRAFEVVPEPLHRIARAVPQRLELAEHEKQEESRVGEGSRRQ